MTKTFRRNDLTDQILHDIKGGNVETLGHLWRNMQNRNPQLKYVTFHQELEGLKDAGLIELAKSPPRGFRDCLLSWGYGFRFWSFAVATIIAFLTVDFLNLGFPLIVLRWIAGTFVVLIAPGYALAWSLFPARSVHSGYYRLALTVALSLFVVPAVALVLNYTSIGIEEEPLVVTISALTFVFLIVGAYREFKNAQRDIRVEASE